MSSRMDPIVSPAGQRVLSHPGKYRHLDSACSQVCFSWVSKSNVFVCRRMYVLLCVCADVSPRQLLFLVVHFHLACDVTQPDTTTTRACETRHRLICKLVVFYHISSLLPLKVFPYVGLRVRLGVCAAYTCGLVGGCAHQRRLLICIYVLAVKLIQITIIISVCDMTLISGQIVCFFSPPFFLSANPLLLDSPF